MRRYRNRRHDTSRRRRDVVISIVLACNVVGGLILVLDQSLADPPDAKLKPIVQQSEAPGLSHKPQPAQLPHETLVQRSEVTPLDQAAGRIFKCVVQGRTVYGSVPCEMAEQSRSLALHIPSGINSPPRENADTLLARRLQNGRQQGASSQVIVLAKPERAQCMALNERVAYLDAL